jgi:molybdenum cofactor biosynthesis enzyme MoaA
VFGAVGRRAAMGGAMTVSIAGNREGIESDLASRSLVVEHLPYHYHVHLNEPCNQRCIMCVPNGKHGNGFMPFERFLTLFEQMRPFAEHITLIGGEPLMYPWIDGVLDILSEHPIAVTINTNVTMLNDRLSVRLLRLHELNLKCSIDAASQSTYLSIRGRDHFKRVTGRLNRFADMARGLTHIRLIPVYVVMRENIDEVVPFVDFARGLDPYRVEFHPVRHVAEWEVTNGTGWTFNGREQVCESFPEQYNEVMRLATESCRRYGIECEVRYL